MSRRELWETVTELTESVLPTAKTAGMIRVTRLSVSMPIELALRTRDDDDPDILADAPRWRWETAYDVTPSRLTIDFASDDEGGTLPLKGSVPLKPVVAA
jgi:hypothetical protein